MAPTPVLRMRTPGEIAALLPHLTGFVPHESLVAVSLRGRRRRVGLTARVDLVGLPTGCRQVADALLRDGARSCVLAVVTEQPSGPAGHPAHGLVADLTADLRSVGVEVRVALLVRGGRWWSYDCTAGCCPPGGTAVDSGSAVVRAAAAQQVLDGQAVLASRAELVASLQPDLPLGAAATQRLQDQALEDLGERLGRGPGAVQRAEQVRWAGALDAWERRPGPLTPGQTAALAVGLHVVQVRDTVASWGVARRDPVLGLLLQLSRGVAPPDDAPLCAVLGFVAYAGGNGALALVAVERALATDPACTLARLLLRAIDAVVPPGQVRRMLLAAA